MKNNFKTNIWKYFIFSFTQRRNFLPILAVYFLTLPDTNIQQIGIYTGIGYVASFLLEIPSGYFADLFGHKKTLVLSKIFMLCSSLSFFLATNFWYFVIGAVFLSSGWAFSSGAGSAFMHETLIKLKRKGDYASVMSKLSANVSLLSIPFILVLPFFTTINIVLPIGLWAVVDLIGLLIIISATKTNNEVEVDLKNKKSIVGIVKEARGDNFFPVAMFDGIVFAFIGAMGIFRPTYLESLGFPVILLGTVMAGSRLIWFFTGHIIYKLEKVLSIKQLFLIEIFGFSTGLLLISLIPNIYLLITLFIILNGYSLGRKELVKSYLLNQTIKNKKYKATLLSVKGQISSILNAVIVFMVGFAMAISYQLGYFYLAIGLFTLLTVSYFFIKRMDA